MCDLTGCRKNWNMGGLGEEKRSKGKKERAGLRGSLEARSERNRQVGIYPHVNEDYSSKHGISQFTIE